MVVLESLQDQCGRVVVEEFALLIEEGALVLIPFENEIPPLADPEVGGEVRGLSADEPAGVKTRPFQGMGEEGGGCCLPVGAGDDDSFSPFEEEDPKGLGHGKVGDCTVENPLSLNVPSTDNVSDNHEVRAEAVDVLFPILGKEGDMKVFDHLLHGRETSRIRSRHGTAPLPEESCQRAHARSAEADQVDPGSRAQREGEGPFRNQLVPPGRGLGGGLPPWGDGTVRPWRRRSRGEPGRGSTGRRGGERRGRRG